jgi:glycosyltransferase involved in cell wall biosynthesis
VNEPHSNPVSRIGVVAIGRNEGERLCRCLRSIAGRAAAVVYVDSGSTDDSRAAARRLGAEVVDLDVSIPFTAARARNAGFARLREILPEIEFVQFVDGDCELRPEWIPAAEQALRDDPRLAAVCGRRRELRPEVSTFNRLCDMEWNTPVGEAKACGGDVLMRTSALVEAGGYDETLIAGEEPELCVRLRRGGWAIRRLPIEMTLHDASMTRWTQWWRRAERSGHAFAEGVVRHGAAPERHWVREARSVRFWGLIVPAVALASAWPTYGASVLLAVAGYAALVVRIYRHGRRRDHSRRDAADYALFTVLGKFPQAVGYLRYHVNRLLSRRTPLIEYKGARA